MRSTHILVSALAVGPLMLLSACAMRWPYDPGDSVYELGNNYGEYQNYGGSPYYHDGIDILGGAPRALYATKGGTVTHVTDDGGGLYTGIMIGAPSAGGSGWLYWHIDASTLAVSVGDVVAEGDYLGDIVSWPVFSFHHVHFNRVVGTGGYPWGWYESTGNPLDWLKPRTDNVTPTFQNAGAGVQFLFCRNDTSTYLDPNSLNGDVDIVARVSDRFNAGTTWDMIPVSMTLKIAPAAGGAAVLERLFLFTHGALGPATTVVQTLYKDDGTADTRGDYTGRIFYFVVTNSDGSLGITAADQPSSWATTAVPNGNYLVTVDAYDKSGNQATASMVVTVAN